MRSKEKRRYFITYIESINFTNKWLDLSPPEMLYNAEATIKNYKIAISIQTRSSQITNKTTNCPYMNK